MDISAKRSPLEIPELLHHISNQLTIDLSSGLAGLHSLLPLINVNHLFHDIVLPKLYKSVKLSGYNSWQGFLKNAQSGWPSVLEFDLRITDQILETGLWAKFLDELVKGSFGRLKMLCILFNCSPTVQEKLKISSPDASEGRTNSEGIYLQLTQLKLDGLLPESLKKDLLSSQNPTYKDLSVSISQLQIVPLKPSVSILISTTSPRPSEVEQQSSASANTLPSKLVLWRDLPPSVECLNFLLSTPFPCPNPFLNPSWQGDNATSQLKAITNFLTSLKKQRALGEQLKLNTIDLSAFSGPSRTWSGTLDTVVQTARAIEGLEVLV